MNPAWVRPVGLLNDNNYCYGNAVLQALVSIPGLLVALRASGQFPDDVIECIFRLAPEPLPNRKSILLGFANLTHWGNNQQDADEFLKVLLNAFHNRGQVRDRFFELVYCEVRQCGSCRAERRLEVSATEIRVTLAVFPREPVNLQDLVNRHFNDLESRQLECPACEVSSITSARTEFGTFSQVQVVVLDRRQSGSTFKVRTRVEIPDTLDLGTREYNLLACIYHIGENVNEGHYIARVKRGNQWFVCDDEDISNYTGGPVRGGQGADEVIVFYLRNDIFKENEDLRQVAEQPQQMHAPPQPLPENAAPKPRPRLNLAPIPDQQQTATRPSVRPPRPPGLTSTEARPRSALVRPRLASVETVPTDSSHHRLTGTVQALVSFLKPGRNLLDTTPFIVRLPPRQLPHFVVENVIKQELIRQEKVAPTVKLNVYHDNPRFLHFPATAHIQWHEDQAIDGMHLVVVERRLHDEAIELLQLYRDTVQVRLCADIVSPRDKNVKQGRLFSVNLHTTMEEFRRCVIAVGLEPLTNPFLECRVYVQEWTKRHKHGERTLNWSNKYHIWEQNPRYPLSEIVKPLYTHFLDVFIVFVDTQHC